MENNDPLQPPPFQQIQQPPPFNPDDPEKEPVRGGCLTALIIFMVIANAITILIYLAMGDKLMRSARLPFYVPYLMSFFGILNIIFLGLTYNWKKAGVIGIIASCIIVTIINLWLGLGLMSFAGLVTPVILIALVNPVWKHFK
jgi:hypothetical protein